ncbi:hypothetical protein CE91St56_59430 [Lachnospiraceae bacterium]|nr:hypothetical protein CE91St56_59430 [Lachnospiraceae bacterium]GKH44900.1 hypothetical protein CE91St57_58740 [Lachnospiraceae bacterium]
MNVTLKINKIKILIVLNLSCVSKRDYMLLSERTDVEKVH